jgi:hypothetical protein
MKTEPVAGLYFLDGKHPALPICTRLLTGLTRFGYLR